MAHDGDPANAAVAASEPSPHLTAEELLKEQTVGLVTLSDFRKRRADIAEQRERLSLQAASSQTSSGTATPDPDSRVPLKKRKRVPVKGKLSFGADEDEDEEPPPARSKPSAAGSRIEAEGPVTKPGSMKANSSVDFVPRAMTKAALAREAESKEKMRKDFLAMRERARDTDILVPFVFYDGTDTPGGKCRIKKGSQVWLFLDKARKVGAERGEDKARRDWARISVDDLILVRDGLILPPHFEFFFFIDKKIRGPSGPLFEYSNEPRVPIRSNSDARTGRVDDDLEGADHEPSLTKVVDRRWYEKNKHIYPASIWQEYDEKKDFSKESRRDPHGNAFFAS